MFDLLLSEPRLYAQALLAWVICIAALVWGGGPERVVAGTWLVVFELGIRLLPRALGEGLQLITVDVWLLSADLCAGAVWICTALYANRNYTLWIAGLQLLAMTSHLAKGLVESISTISYAFMAVTPSWFQLAFLAIGVVRHVQRKRRYGSYCDWRVASTPVGAAGGIGSTQTWLSPGSTSWRDDLK